MTDVVHVLPLAHVRTMASAADPNYVILRFTTADGEEFNFGLDHASFCVVIRANSVPMESEFALVVY